MESLGRRDFPTQMAFLLTGPMFDLKLLFMYQCVIKPKTIVVLSSLILGFVLAVFFVQAACDKG
jgi:hypothetical protein